MNLKRYQAYKISYKLRVLKYLDTHNITQTSAKFSIYRKIKRVVKAGRIKFFGKLFYMLYPL